MKGANEEGRLRVSMRRTGAGDSGDAVTGQRCGRENGGASRLKTSEDDATRSPAGSRATSGREQRGEKIKEKGMGRTRETSKTRTDR